MNRSQPRSNCRRSAWRVVLTATLSSWACILAVAAEGEPGSGVSASPRQSKGVDYLAMVRSHFEKVFEHGRDTYGAEKTPMWLAAVDLRRGGLPERPDPRKARTYRAIHAPNGSTLYWDQPALVAAVALSRVTDEPRYREAAEAYVPEFLRRCVSPRNGLFLWGNHIYYDVIADQNVKIGEWYHEARPLPPAWGLFWAVDPKITATAIRQMGQQHVGDRQRGAFDRHASVLNAPDGPGMKPGCAFLEAGGILVESLAWLSAREEGREPSLNELALRVARYSFEHRGAATGLLRNKPGNVRWDYHVATTEVGTWAASLLRAADYSGIGEFRTMAHDAVAAYLRYGWDAKAERYYGSVRVEDGMPWRERETPYQPDLYADPWLQATWPTHDYPMGLAEACLTLYQQTGEEPFREAVDRWVRIIRESLPANGGAGAWADQYGRCLHFLVRTAQVLDDREVNALAERVAAEAAEQLYVADCGMFRSHPGEDRCNAVDAPGILFLALIYLQTGQEPDGMGFAF